MGEEKSRDITGITVRYSDGSTTGTIEGKQQIGRLDVLSLMYGMRITNNWLKMHGGIMARNGGKKKKRRLF